MRIKEIHRRILGGCLACLLCFTGSIPAFAAETATPANADERRENPPGLESKASETLEIGTPETPEASEEVSLVLVTEIQNEGELLSLPDFTLPLRTTPSDDDLEEIYQLALQYQTVCATVTAGEKIRQETFSVAWDFSAIDQTTPGEYTAAGRIELPDGYAFGEAVLQELQISVRVEEMPPAVITSIEQWYPYTDAFAVQQGSETETLENLFAFSPYYLECYAENGTSYTAVVEWDFSGIDLNTVGLYYATGRLTAPENTVFADAFNYLIYNGKKVIDPAKLKEIDPTEIALPFDDEEKAGKEKDGEDKNRKAQGTEWSSVKNGSVRKKTAGRAGKKTDAVQKYRDILKSAVIKQDEKMSYVLLGIENQTDVHYAMPVRNAIYDALQYGRQVADIAAEHRRNKKDFTGKSNGEYLSGFLKEDCIKPVITLVIHFGAEEWDGPLSLHEMMSVSDIEILSFVENYRIHLIDPAKLTEEQLNKFSTSMREVIGYIKYSKNKDKLLEFLRTDTHKSIEMNAARVIKTITKTPIKISEEKEGIEMCQAIEELIAESEARGEVRGKAEGMIEMCLEMNIPKKGIIKRLQDKLNISMQQADEYFRMYGTKND